MTESNGNQDNKGRFTKGNTAQKASVEARASRSKKADIKAYCQRNSMRAARQIMAIALDESANASDRLKAAQYIVDRGYGKPETAGNHASGLFAGATIMVDTGIKRELEPPTVDVSPAGSMNGQDSSTD